MATLRLGDITRRFIQDPTTGTTSVPEMVERACKTLFSTSAGLGAIPHPLR